MARDGSLWDLSEIQRTCEVARHIICAWSCYHLGLEIELKPLCWKSCWMTSASQRCKKKILRRQISWPRGSANYRLVATMAHLLYSCHCPKKKLVFVPWSMAKMSNGVCIQQQKIDINHSTSMVTCSLAAPVTCDDTRCYGSPCDYDRVQTPRDSTQIWSIFGVVFFLLRMERCRIWVYGFSCLFLFEFDDISAWGHFSLRIGGREFDFLVPTNWKLDLDTVQIHTHMYI